MLLSSHKYKFLAVIVFLFLAILACNFPNNNPSITEDSELKNTVIAQTLEAQMTQIAKDGSPTQPSTLQPPVVPIDTSDPLTQTPVLSPNTPAPSPTETSIPCDEVQFVEDITVDDGIEISAGEPFEKFWRLKNAGSCSWTSDYDVVFISGTQMGSPEAQQLTTETVIPSQVNRYCHQSGCAK